MFKKTASTCSHLFGFVSEVNKPRRLFCQISEQSFQTATKPCAVDIATIYAWKVALKDPQAQEPVADSVNQPETMESGHLMRVNQAALLDIFNVEVEHYVNDRIKDSIAAAVSETLFDAIYLAIVLISSLQKSISNDPIDISMSRMM